MALSVSDIEKLGLGNIQARIVFCLLSSTPKNAEELSRATRVTKARISQTMKDLIKFSVVETKKQGKQIFYFISDSIGLESYSKFLLEEKRKVIENQYSESQTVMSRVKDEHFDSAIQVEFLKTQEDINGFYQSFVNKTPKILYQLFDYDEVKNDKKGIRSKEEIVKEKKIQECNFYYSIDPEKPETPNRIKLDEKFFKRGNKSQILSFEDYILFRYYEAEKRKELIIKNQSLAELFQNFLNYIKESLNKNT